ncbi:MAG: hypothetical protein ACYSR6_06880, partial [Planctomycetota bacterium]
TGSFWSFDLSTVTSPQLWRLDQSVMTGASIFEYPWQILVLGLLMGILAIVPILVSQLMSFSYSVPLLLGVAFLANLPAFAACLLISCVAAACRPLRFRSRFTAIALCTAPQLIYWGYFGGAKAAEPIRWGFSFAPWICAWIVGLGIAGLVLGVGHFTRYRPGLVLAFSFLFLLLAVVTFEIRIGFDELDYQLYVAKNDPEQINEFHDHSITEALDRTITDPAVRDYLAGFFYPTEPIPLRAELKREILVQLGQARWPGWFIVPTELKYQAKKQWLFKQYDSFITRRPASRRMPVALYYKALLTEYTPDINILAQKEILHFYSDYPHERSREIWHELYSEFGESPESIEARWRIASHWARVGKFEQADGLLAEAQTMAADRLKPLENEQTQSEALFGLFRPPADSAVTAFSLTELQRRLNQLRTLISSENHTGEADAEARLAKFVMLNPYSPDYPWHLDQLLGQMQDNDPLRDNVLLAQTKLVADEQLRAEKLAQLHRKFQEADGGMRALYELARLRIGLYQSETNVDKKKQYLAEARATLMSFISLYPESFCARQVQKILDDLPTVD